MSKEQISYNYSSDEVLKQEMEIHDLTLDSIEKELPKTEAKSLAFSKLIAAVEQDLYNKVKRVNELVDEIKGFHEARLAGTGDDTALNAVLASYNSSIPIFPPLTFLNRDQYDPNSSSNARDYLDDTLNKAAWFSNIGFTSSVSGFNTDGSGYDSRGVYEPRYNPEFSHSFVVVRGCNITLNEDDHWDGTYKQEYVQPTPGTYKPSAGGGEPQLENVPNLVCPTDQIPEGDGIVAINKINIKIYGYSLEGENPVEVKESDLNEDTVGIGTFNVLQNIRNVYDVGINTNNSVSFSYDGKSFSGDITEGSSNYNSYLKPRYDEIDDLRDEINDMLPDINKMKDMRKKSDLYTWSLKFSQSDTKKEKKKKNDSLGTFDKFQNKYKDVLNFPEPQTEEITRGKTFKELTEKEKRELSETYGLGIPKNVKKIKDPKTGKQELDKKGNPKWTTDEGFNKNYDEEKLKKFLKENPNITVIADFTVTETGSIVVIDSVGTATTFTGITTQVNRITTGAMNSNNVGSGASITDQEFTVVGYTTGNVLPSPAVEVGIAVTYSGSIGTSQRAWKEGYFDEVVANTFTGAATSIRTASIDDTLDEDLPLIITVGANTEGKSDIKPVVSSKLTFNPATGELSVGVISATELIVETGSIGVATAANIEDGGSDTDGILLFTDFIGNEANLLGDSGIRVNPSRNEIIANRFSGIISATDVNAGVTTLSQLEVTGVSTFTGDVSFGSTVTFGDDDKLKFGDDEDLQIYHDGTHSYIDETGTGQLIVKTTQFLVRNDVNHEILNGASGGPVNLYYSNVKKFETTGTGVTVYGNIDLGDNDKIQLGVGTDLQIYHDGTNSYIKEGGAGALRVLSSRFQVKNPGDTKLSIDAYPAGEVALRYDNSKKFETTGVGVSVFGRIYASESADFTGNLNITGVATVGTIGAGTGNITTLNSTTINNSGHLESGFIDVGIVTANTGIVTSGYIEHLSVEEQIFTTDGNDDIDSTFDQITISYDAQGRSFTDSDQVIYVAGSPGLLPPVEEAPPPEPATTYASGPVFN